MDTRCFHDAEALWFHIPDPLGRKNIQATPGLSLDNCRISTMEKVELGAPDLVNHLVNYLNKHKQMSEGNLFPQQTSCSLNPGPCRSLWGIGRQGLSHNLYPSNSSLLHLALLPPSPVARVRVLMCLAQSFPVHGNNWIASLILPTVFNTKLNQV